MIKNGRRDELHRQVKQIEDILRKQIDEYLKDYTQESIGSEVGKSAAWISQALNPLNDTQFYITQFPVLIELLGPEVLMKIAENIGYFLVPFPNVKPGKKDFKDFAKVLKEFSEFTSEVAGAFEDGTILEDERNRIWNEGSELISEAFSFMKAVKDSK